MSNSTIINKSKKQQLIEQQELREKISFIYKNAKTINEQVSIQELEMFIIGNCDTKLFEDYNLKGNEASYVDAIQIIFKLCEHVNASNRSDDEKISIRNKLRIYTKHFPIENQAELRKLNEEVSFDKEKVNAIRKRKY